jgi:hypothetical protein
MIARRSTMTIFAVGLFLSACGGQANSGGDVADQARVEQGAADQRIDGQASVAAGAAQAEAPDSTWSFDDVPAGSLPPGWKAEQTNPRGQGAEWSVQQDASAPSGGQVLALTNTRGASGGTFNLAWTHQVPFQDGRIEVKVKAGTGREDQGGGPIWRVQDRNNYYIARWNPLEDNFRLYYVQDGRRRQLESANVDLPADQWHTIAIDYQGNRIVAYLNGSQMFETTDDTFAQAGGVGVWTKADAATSFDDLVVTGGGAR